MHVDCDQCLILFPLHLFKVFCGLADEEVEHVQESCVCVSHYLLVNAAVTKCILSISEIQHVKR